MLERKKRTKTHIIYITPSKFCKISRNLLALTIFPKIAIFFSRLFIQGVNRSIYLKTHGFPLSKIYHQTPWHARVVIKNFRRCVEIREASKPVT